MVTSGGGGAGRSAGRGAVPAAAVARGRYRSNRVPRPGADSHSTHPLCCLTMPWTIGSPSPVPWPTGLVVKNGS